ncbi:hypothetical protein [Paraliomyxa miuraensis]|uniref:hypothetical protein n=1 Tax=Paraliomyxa miuraensis TaxID=376150 RepID=UPI00225012E8|nr:hypothetical protein [Paraliomyxa miuraensis]MCX4245706.1 hypothetical protein [Paraliomyxa miuraensis]
MKLVTADLADGSALDPGMVLAHLRAGEWEQVDEHHLDGRHVVTLFEHQRRPEVEVHVPVWQEARDYSRILAEAINTIAAAEGRSAAALLSELRAGRSDVLSIHAGEGTLTLLRATAMLSAIRALYAAATRGLGYGLRAAGGSPLAPTNGLLDRITLELGEPGHRIVRASVPVVLETTALGSHAAERGPVRSGRRSTEIVATLLDGVARATRGRSVQRVAEELVALGAGPASCSALASVGGPLTFEITWALAMPRARVSPVTLTQAQLTRLARAVERMPPAASG